MATLTVGTDGQFATLAAAIAASHDGDTLQVQAGTYANDFAVINTRITIEGVGGMVDLVATQAPPNGKAILVTNTDVTIENVVFSGCGVPDGNGAGIRYQGGNLVLRNDLFQDNQNGLLAAPDPSGSITIDQCEFAHNGSGTGYTHNLYVNEVGTLTITDSYFHDAVVGHEIKSRADNTIIENNVIEDGPDGTASYSIDLPNGGNALVEGNYIEKGPHSQNPAMIHFGGEGLPYGNSSLTVTGNTMVNDLASGSASGVLNQTLTQIEVSGNTISGLPAGRIAVGPAVQTGNIAPDGTSLPDSSTTIPVGGSNAIIFTDAAPHTVALTKSFQAVQGGDGLLTVTTTAGHETVVGGSGGLVYTSVGGDLITTMAGATDTITLAGAATVASAGTDVINLGFGNATVQVKGAATVNGGTGSNGIELDGNDVLNSVGVDTVVAGRGAHAAITAANWLSLSETGADVTLTLQGGGDFDTATVSGGSVSLKAVAGNGGLMVTTAGGAAGTTLTLGAGNDLVYSNGGDTIFAGAGSTGITLSGASEIHAGTGPLSLYGNGGMATVYGGAGSYFFGGHGGGIDFIGGSGQSTIDDHLSGNLITGGSGRLTVSDTAGRNTVQGGSGGLDFTTTVGADTITTQAGATDRITLALGSYVNSAGTDVINVGGGNSTIVVSGNSTVSGGTGSNHYTLGGDDLLVSRGFDAVTVGSGAHAAISATTFISVSETNATVSLAMLTPSTADAVTVSGGTATIGGVGAKAGISVSTGATGGVAIQLGSGSDTVWSAGADTISAAAGAASVQASGAVAVAMGTGSLFLYGSGSGTVQGGAGTFSYSGWGSGGLTFAGGSGNAVISGAQGALDVTAGAGNITLSGGSASRFVAGSGQAVVRETSGSNSVIFGSRSTTVLGGGGTDLYRFVAGQGGGTDLISNFRIGFDKLSLEGFAADPIQSQSAGAAGLTLSLADGTQVTLAGIQHFDSRMVA
jgi:hypothetical protein